MILHNFDPPEIVQRRLYEPETLLLNIKKFPTKANKKAPFFKVLFKRFSVVGYSITSPYSSMNVASSTSSPWYSMMSKSPGS